LIPGLAKLYGMKGIALLGETPGFPIVTDPNAAEAVIKVLEKMLGIKVDLSRLHEKVEEMHEFVKRIEELQREAMEEMKKKKAQEELKYIG
jgi:proteasome assembly chaperone (PAC2) family protein